MRIAHPSTTQSEEDRRKSKNATPVPAMRSDIVRALQAGFSPDEVAYMLDLPNITGWLETRSSTAQDRQEGQTDGTTIWAPTHG